MVSKFVSKFESIMCHSKLKTGYLGMLNSHALGVLPYKNVWFCAIFTITLHLHFLHVKLVCVIEINCNIYLEKKKKFSKDKDSFCSSFHVPVHHPVFIAVYAGFSESSCSCFHWSQCTIIFLQFSLGYSQSTVKHKQDTRDRPYLSTVGPHQRASACQQFL